MMGCNAAENRLRETNVDFSFLTRERREGKVHIILAD